MPDKAAKKRRTPVPRHSAPHSVQSLVVCGSHTVLSFLEQKRVQQLYVLASGGARVQAAKQQAHAAGIPVLTRSPQALTQLAGEEHHQGVVAEVSLPQASVKDISRQPKPLVVVDGVTDPRNLGALLRVTRAFAGAAVIAPARRSAPLSAATVRAAAGAAADIPLLRVPNISRLLRQLDAEGRTIIAAAEDSSTDLFSRRYPPDTCWVLGDEGSGIRRLVREQCHDSVRIPTIAGAGGCLNVVTAGAVCLAAAAAAAESRAH